MSRRSDAIAKPPFFLIYRARLSKELSVYIHGVEIDGAECESCRKNLSEIASEFEIYDVDWDIVCADTLTVSDYDGKMDYVVGNPPYVRVHNLRSAYDTVKKYFFTQSGMTDLFIAFYEIGLKMLNHSGILGYISPSSLYNSIAGSAMRKYLAHNRSIKKIVDLKHFQPFEATAYTTIMILTKECNRYVDYYEYDAENLVPAAVSRLGYEDFNINGSFVFGHKCVLSQLRSVMTSVFSEKLFEVKNGFATLCDEFFIGDWTFTDYTIPIVKASTGNMTKCLFPYDNFGRIIPFDVLTKNIEIKSHYDRYIDKLKARSLDGSGNWYGFGRSQGINDVQKKKYAINALIRNVGDIKLSLCEPGTGIYGGLYILTDCNIDGIKNILFTDEFITYISMLGKYKSGGYYTYSSKDLQRFLNYGLSKREGCGYEQLFFS
ncbi:MAG: N-6 DNA methylase [Clostridiales bacterium]|nr:N-6 DNA methylase [Clostridiales bacterium]